MSEKPDYEAIWKHADSLPWRVLVMAGGRVGSDFFQSLVDFHPDVFCFNGQLNFHGFWESATTTQHPDGPELEDVLTEFIGKYLKHFRSRYDHFERKGALGENQDQSIHLDLKAFNHHVLALCGPRPVSCRNLLLGIFVAYSLCLGEDIFRKKIFFHHQHHIKTLPPFLKDFPDSKIICMTRDPRAVYVSGVEHWRKYEPGTDNPSYPLYIFRRIVDEANPLLSLDRDRVRTIRLEDLGDERTLSIVCDWIGVPFHQNVAHSTWAGLRWWGDAVSQERPAREERGFSKTVTQNKWKLVLGEIDVYVLDYLLEQRLRWLGYESSHRFGFLADVLMLALIFLPTTFERRYLTPRYLVGKLIRGKLKDLARSFYHPLRRAGFFWSLYWRRNRSGYEWLTVLRP